MAIKLLPDLETQKRIADAIEEVANKIGTAGACGGYIEITYADLVALRNNSQLVPGAFYRITDYETTTVQADTRSAGHLFDIIVQALDEKTVSENAQAIHSERDVNGYFDGVKLEAWKLKYILDNDRLKYYWADDINGKGVIYRMIDEYENDLPYDFKNIQFKRYMIDEYSDNTEFEGRYYALKDLGGNTVPNDAVIDENDFIWAYMFTVIDEAGVVNDISLNANKAFQSDEGTYYYTEKNIIGIFYYDYWDDVLEKSVRLEALPNSVMIYDYDFYGYWEFYGFNNNTIGNDFSYNTIGNNFNNNTIGNSFYANTIGNSFYANTIGNRFYYNTIGNDFNNNTIGNGFNANTIGNGYYNNTIGNDFYYNTIGNGFNNNTIGNSFYYNTVDENVKYIQFSVDGGSSNQIRYLHLKSGLRGSSDINQLDLHYTGLYHREYPTTFEIIANGNVISSWEATPLTRAGKVKATNTTPTWSDI